jgi:hypothetical protein
MQNYFTGTTRYRYCYFGLANYKYFLKHTATGTGTYFVVYFVVVLYTGKCRKFLQAKSATGIDFADFAFIIYPPTLD